MISCNLQMFSSFHLLHSYVTLDIPETTTTTFEQRQVPVLSQIVKELDNNPRSHFVAVMLVLISAIFILLYLSASLLPMWCRGSLDPIIDVYEYPVKSQSHLQSRLEVSGVNKEHGTAGKFVLVFRVGGATGTNKRPTILCEKLCRPYRPLDQREDQDFKRKSHAAFLAAACRHAQIDKLGGAYKMNNQVTHSKSSIPDDEEIAFFLGNSKCKNSNKFEI